MIILDTGVLFGFAVESDEKHNDSVRIIKGAMDGDYGTIAITDYIFDETITLTLARTKDLSKAIEVGEYLNDLEIIKVDQETFDDAWKIFKSQKIKKLLSFTDCTTLAAMNQNKIDKLASFDSGFKQIKGLKVIE